MSDSIEVPRPASPPTVGALRDSVRTTVAIAIGVGIAKMLGDDTASQAGEAITYVAAIAVSAFFAWLGKVFRSKVTPNAAAELAGKVI